MHIATPIRRRGLRRVHLHPTKHLRRTRYPTWSHTSFSTTGISKRQGCVSHSTPEAEIVAASFALRNTGLPGLAIWDIIFPHQPPLLVHEDNQTMIRCMKTGKNQGMRYLGRTHRCSVAWLHERFRESDLALMYDISSRMCADIYTKAFTELHSGRRYAGLSALST